MSLYAIKAHYNDSVYIGFDEFVIEKDAPLFMEELTSTMGEEGFVWSLAAYVLRSKIFEIIWQLWQSLSTQSTESKKFRPLTVWKYATWLQRLHNGLQCQYFNSFPKNK